MHSAESRHGLKPGDWVSVRPEHDIPPVFRDHKPTRGRIHSVDGDIATVWVPIGNADVDEHSNSVPYLLGALERG